jgi:hypothetical protein
MMVSYACPVVAGDRIDGHVAGVGKIILHIGEAE